jgi:hypothetical protein
VHAFHLLWCVNKDNAFSYYPPDPSRRERFKLTKGEAEARKDPLEAEWVNSYV